MAFKLNVILLVKIESTLAELNVVQGDPVHLFLVKSILQLALLGHLFAEAKQLFCTLFVVCVRIMIVQKACNLGNKELGWLFFVIIVNLSQFFH